MGKSIMTLGEIIDALRRKEPEQTIAFDFVYFAPKGITSYRGYYDQLAIGYEQIETTVAEVLAMCNEAVGKTFTGYKGGDYVMGRETPVWVANRSESGSTAIVDIIDHGWRITIETAHIE